MFNIEDETHCQIVAGDLTTLAEAVTELTRLAAIPWNQQPNKPPCMGWHRCGRRYVIVECDEAGVPWQQLRRIRGVDISANGVIWPLDPAL